MSTELSANNFSVLDFIQGTKYPTEEVTLFTDIDAVTHYNTLEAQRKDALKKATTKARREGTPEPNPEDFAPTADELVLVDRINKSALTFKLRGLSPEVLKEIADRYKDIEDEEENAKQYLEMITKSIVAVRNVDGNIDSTPWDIGKLEMLEKALPQVELVKLMECMFRINFATKSYIETIDAGFPVGRTATATELPGNAGSGSGGGNGHSAFGPAANG